MPKGKRNDPPEDRSQGWTGKFVECVAGKHGTHPEMATAYEVKWSVSQKARGKPRTSYYILCAICKTRTFLNGWRPKYGMTLVEAEAKGFTLLGLSQERKDELLAELGLEQVQPRAANAPPLPPPGYPGPFGPPPQQLPPYRPRRRKRKPK